MPRPTMSGSGIPFGNPVERGADLLVYAQHRGILVGADEEARGDDDLVVLRLRIDMLDAVDALDDVFERPGDKLDRLAGLVAIGGDHDVDQRHADLRLLLARQRDGGDQAGHQRRDQQQRRQRRANECAGEIARQAEFHGVTILSPSTRPERISMVLTPLSSWASPGCTTTSSPSASLT